MILYKLLSILFLPLIYLYLFIRILNKKEDKLRIKERLGFSTIKKSSENLIWIHCVSVGESNSAIILIEKILENNPNSKLLFTSSTITSASQIKRKFHDNNRIIHQFLPIDDIFSINRFLKYWRPQLAIFIESEIWPNLIHQCSKHKIKLALINARISDKSYKRWLILHKLGFNILKNFKICFAQSKADQQKLIKLGVKNTEFIGNLKSCAKKLDFDEIELKSLNKQIGVRKFWFAASTHKGEEEIIIKTHQKLQKQYPDLLTIIAPRHPNRLEEITKNIPKNIKIKIRSKKEAIKKNTNIYIADTLGEMGLFYKLSNISFISGSLIKDIGGHNPFEALKLDSAVITGKYFANFDEIYQELERNKIIFIANSNQDLYKKILDLLNNNDILQNIINNWRKYHNSNNLLEKLIKKLK
ncbi:3-deoxy-D-manno-octulosonic acid transferase [Rickettsiales bacterium]|nr:3-deoxy-D-manno-octulosonic acid transferase [Rickettsiales bacterium]